ncbi:MAG: chemotaxis protein CheW [Gammaproteobacteria bacterium]|nr:chemotaxis protein CheW [Gammaproteobacteria bacterium]
MSATAQTKASGEAATPLEEYLTFNLGSEDYGVDILRVQEIRGWEPITRIPNAPEYVRGVLNLRGSIVPVFDLRLRLGMSFRAYEKETVVIILHVQTEEREKSIGLVVDNVSDVFRTSTESIQPVPDFGTRFNSEFLSGMTTANGRMVMLLDIDRLSERNIKPVAAAADDEVQRVQSSDKRDGSHCS